MSCVLGAELQEGHTFEGKEGIKSMNITCNITTTNSSFHGTFIEVDSAAVEVEHDEM